MQLLEEGNPDRTFKYKSDMKVGDLIGKNDKLAIQNLNNFVIDTAIKNYLNELILPSLLEQKKIRDSYKLMTGQFKEQLRINGEIQRKLQ